MKIYVSEYYGCTLIVCILITSIPPTVIYNAVARSTRTFNIYGKKMKFENTSFENQNK